MYKEIGGVIGRINNLKWESLLVRTSISQVVQTVNSHGIWKLKPLFIKKILWEEKAQNERALKKDQILGENYIIPTFEKLNNENSNTTFKALQHTPMIIDRIVAYMFL